VTRFITCRTCGKFVDAGAAVARAYCTDECTRLYTACTNCGKYFLRGKGHDDEHCSRDCAIKYQIFRKYGPEPVTVVTEV
jgi:hypothetical protein